MPKIITWKCDRCSAEADTPEGFVLLTITRKKADGSYLPGSAYVAKEIVWCQDCSKSNGLDLPELPTPPPTIDDLLYDMVESAVAHQSGL